MTVQLRIGLLGCGAIASAQHVRALTRIEGAELVAAADPEASARAAVTAIGIDVLEDSRELLTRTDIDAVLVATPTHLHANLAVSAAKAGKHVYVEKPIATSVEDAVAVADAIERAGIVGAVGFNRRFHPLCRQARRIVRDGRIGRVRVVSTAFCEPLDIAQGPGWRQSRATGGGVLLDLGSHHFDLLRWLLDDDLSVVGATLGSERSEHDTATVTLTTTNDVHAQSTFSYVAGYADFVELVGERGTLRIDRHRPRLDLRVGRRTGYGIRRAAAGHDRAVLAWRLGRLERRGDEPSYRNALRAFVCEIVTGKSLVATPTDGLRSLETVLAAEQHASVSPPG